MKFKIDNSDHGIISFKTFPELQVRISGHASYQLMVQSALISELIKYARRGDELPKPEPVKAGDLYITVPLIFWAGISLHLEMVKKKMKPLALADLLSVDVRVLLPMLSPNLSSFTGDGSDETLTLISDAFNVLGKDLSFNISDKVLPLESNLKGTAMREKIIKGKAPTFDVSNVDTEIRHVTKAGTDIFKDLGFSDEDKETNHYREKLKLLMEINAELCRQQLLTTTIKDILPIDEIEKLVIYIMESEGKHYEEHSDDMVNPENHIYAVACAVKEAFKFNYKVMDTEYADTFEGAYGLALDTTETAAELYAESGREMPKPDKQ